MISRLLFGSMVLMMSLSAHAGFCDDPIRDRETCYKMRTLRAQIDLLDAQRDLMQVNYPLINAVAGQIRALVKSVLEHTAGDHLAALRGVEGAAQTLSEQAVKQNVDALTSANNLRQQCLACHGGENPSSGIRWEKISEDNWNKIIVHCNNESTRPYLCKSMNGLRAVYSSFIAGYYAGVQTFESLIESTKEIKRIALDLKSKGFVHDNSTRWDDLVISAEELERLAKNRDTRAFDKAFGMNQSCLRCHGR